MENAVGAMQRATLVYCKRRPEMHLFSARFEERHGNIEACRAIYKYVLGELAPRLVQVVTAAANFERRHGNKDAACAYYEELIREEKSKENAKVYAFLSILYANMLQQQYNDLEKARETLKEAQETCPNVKSVWEASVFFEETVRPADMVERVLSIYNTCTAPVVDSSKGLTDKEREELSLRSVEFADQFADPETLYRTEKLHASRFMLPTTVVESSRKRGMPDAAAAASMPAVKAPKAEHPPPAAPPAAPPPAPSQAPAPPAAAASYYPQGTAAAGTAAYPYASYYSQYPSYGYGYGY